MGKQILLAHDDELLAYLLNFRLEKEGYELHHSRNVREVKKYLSEQMPGTALSNPIMSRFSKIELTDYVRKQSSSNTPVIISISSNGKEENLKRSNEGKPGQDVTAINVLFDEVKIKNPGPVNIDSRPGVLPEKNP